ncbi:MAG: sensor domain-containing diguanylate cyclase [Clostridiales bacterium]|nr:sensor domain-containing diguanylate cyclase [Clostridiales bacterium]
MKNNIFSLFDSLPDTGIFVVSEREHKILFFNSFAVSAVPSLHQGALCEEIFGCRCCDRCPLTGTDEAECGKFVSFSSPIASPADVTISKIMWDDSIPAYLFVFSKHIASEQEIVAQNDKNYMYEALAKVYPLCLSVNLSENTYNYIQYKDYMLQDINHDSGSYDELIERVLPTIQSDQQFFFGERFTRRSLLGAFEKGKKEVYEEFRQRGDDGVYRWASFRVMRVEDVQRNDVRAIIFVRIIDEQKKIEMQLKTLLDATQQNMQGFVARCRILPDNVELIEASNKFYEYFTSSPDEYKTSLFPRIPPEQRKAFFGNFYSLAQAEEQISYTFRDRTPTKGDVWVQIDASCIGRDDEGYPLYHGVLTDITHIVKLQKQLEESVDELKSKNSELEEFYHTIIIGVAKFVDDENHTLIFANENFYEITGYTAEEFKSNFGDSAKGMIFPKDLEGLRFSSVPGEVFSNRCRVVKKDGSVMWVRMDASLTGEMYGEHAVYYAFYTNIDKQVEQERDMLRQQYFSSLITSSIAGGTAISRVETERPILYVGESLLDFLGYTAEEFASKYKGKLVNLVMPDDCEESKKRYEEQLANGDYYELEYKVKKSDDSIIWVMEKGRKSTDDNGDPINISVILDITDRKLQQAQLLRKSQTDMLTGIYNRSFLQEDVNAYLDLQMNKHSSALVILDLDNFKQVNDTYGHLEGDAVLKEVAQLLKSNFRDTDVVGRIGGDEFVVFMKWVDNQETVEQRVERVRSSIEEKFKGKYTPAVTASIGVAYMPDISTSYKELLQVADVALYLVKDETKNAWKVLNLLPENAEDEKESE